MYYIIDLRQDPPIRVPDLVLQTEKECCDWIDENGDASIYTFEKDMAE
jgi:hypothetical protein